MKNKLSKLNKAGAVIQKIGKSQFKNQTENNFYGLNKKIDFKRNQSFGK